MAGNMTAHDCAGAWMAPCIGGGCGPIKTPLLLTNNDDVDGAELELLFVKLRTELCHDSVAAADGDVFLGCRDSLRPIMYVRDGARDQRLASRFSLANALAAYDQPKPLWSSSWGLAGAFGRDSIR